MADLKSRAAWVVNLGRVANGEYGRMQYGQVWKQQIDGLGGYLAYMRRIQPEGWWMVPYDNRCRPKQPHEEYAKPVLQWVWA